MVVGELCAAAALVATAPLKTSRGWTSTPGQNAAVSLIRPEYAVLRIEVDRDEVYQSAFLAPQRNRHTASGPSTAGPGSPRRRAQIWTFDPRGTIAQLVMRRAAILSSEAHFRRSSQSALVTLRFIARVSFTDGTEISGACSDPPATLQSRQWFSLFRKFLMMFGIICVSFEDHRRRGGGILDREAST